MNKTEKQRIYIQQVGLVGSIIAISRICGSDLIILINTHLDTLRNVSTPSDDLKEDYLGMYLKDLDNVTLKMIELSEQTNFEYKEAAETMAEQIKQLSEMTRQRYEVLATT